MKAPSLFLSFAFTLWVCAGPFSITTTHAAEPTSPSQTAAPDNALFRKENLAAWCIVPFDKAKRGPEERAAMLEKLGLTHFVYDYRAEHIPQWDEELDALKRHKIDLVGWWFPGSLNGDAQKALDLFKRHNVTPMLWITGGGTLTSTPEEQEARVNAEVARIKPIAEAAENQHLKVALYNHGNWFGEPENQIAIIERLKTLGIQNVGIVYNQHHGHGHIERFPELIQKMLPYLLFVNLNGMDIKGDTVGRKIIPIGTGTEDVRLLKIIRESGYKGPIGILNHTNEDAEERLRDNLAGLSWILPQLDGKAPGPKPEYVSWKPPVAK